MKQPLKLSFVLFVLIVIVVAAFVLSGAGPSSAQEDVNPDSSADTADQAEDFDLAEAISYYSDRSTFDGDFPGLPSEDFESGIVGYSSRVVCPAPVDVKTDDGTCFDMGDILPTIQFSDSPGPGSTGLALIGKDWQMSGSGPAPSKILAANNPNDTLDIIFTEDTVYQVGLDIFIYYLGGPVDISVFGSGGFQIGAVSITASDTGTFWGVSADQPITRINLASTGASLVEGVDNISYGNIPSPSNPGGFLYVFEELDAEDNWIHIFREDKSSGVLTEITSSPKKTGGTGFLNGLSEHLAFDSTNNRLFAVNDGSNTLSGFSVNQGSGVLSEMFTPSSIGAMDSRGICVHPTGSQVIVGDVRDVIGNVKSFNIASNSATEADSETGSDQNWGCEFTNDGSYFFQSGAIGGNFSSYSINRSTGVLTHLGINNIGNSDQVAWPELDSSDRLFMASYLSGSLYAFTTSSGIPTKIAGPVPSGLKAAHHAIRHPSGYFYSVDRSSNQVAVSEITGTGAGTSFSIINGSPFSTGGEPGGQSQILAFGYDDSFLYVANALDRNVSSFLIDKSTGYLKFLTVQPVDSAGSFGRITGMVYVDAIRANFTGSPTSGPVNHTVNFTNSSTGPFTSCLWKFGDGAESTSCGNPSHTYKQIGTYNVSLTVNSPGSSHIKSRSSYVKVTNVVADFTASPTSGRVNHTVTFTNKSSGDYTGCSWNFGDGGSSTSCGNPSHTYTKPGTYNVSLALSVSGGGDTKTRNNYITVSNVMADFTGSPTSGRVNHTVTFTNKSLGNYSDCFWNFGDGEISTSCGNPSHTYSKSGSYDVILTLNVVSGGVTKARENYIAVQNAEVFVSLTVNK